MSNPDPVKSLNVEGHDFSKWSFEDDPRDEISYIQKDFDEVFSRFVRLKEKIDRVEKDELSFKRNDGFGNFILKEIAGDMFMLIADTPGNELGYTSDAPKCVYVTVSGVEVDGWWVSFDLPMLLREKLEFDGEEPEGSRLLIENLRSEIDKMLSEYDVARSARQLASLSNERKPE